MINAIRLLSINVMTGLLNGIFDVVVAVGYVIANAMYLLIPSIQLV